MERNELCWCGSGKKYKKCHMPIEEKMLMHAERGEIVPSKSLLKTPAQIEKIRESAVQAMRSGNITLSAGMTKKVWDLALSTLCHRERSVAIQ